MTMQVGLANSVRGLFAPDFVVSVLVLVFTTLAAEIDGPLAAAVATAPTGLPLAYYLVAGKLSRSDERGKPALDGHQQEEQMLGFCRAALKGMVANVFFCVGLLMGVKTSSGGSLLVWPLTCAFGAWGVGRAGAGILEEFFL